ncbi:MAG: ArdC family protein [Planctomycetota bacterium]|jgi:antirestriction protein ArdC
MSKVYDYVTERILEHLEKGTVPWRKPWAGGDEAPKNLISKKGYRGINPFLLACAGYSSPWWMTYKQAAQLGGQVRKGEKGSMVIFWKPPMNGDKDAADPKDRKGSGMILRYYRVFNAAQVDGLEAALEKVTPKTDKPAPKVDPIEAAEAVYKGWTNCPPVKWEGSQACYIPAQDVIRMPPRETFKGSAEVYSTLFHEMTHSTGHKDRLNRESLQKLAAFGSHEYSKEELVAEFGAAFLSAHAGISAPVIENQAAYINGWKNKLRQKDAARWVVWGASQGQKAAELILGTKKDD